ncbi:E3 ubiquitin-protein ligase RNF220-like [Penaeus japonicus]|uniref:E3 ubiquitin-protein ligase RNF220-like n=1 Tax=Penaeus japonicus TaxID=27405 RepID=UPI001C70BACF|nr:E3 ubiquitin-protein ligase RNF220-like [Penaeus japonicus]
MDAGLGRKPRPGESWCPVCGVTLRPGELEAHLTHELDKLARLPQTRPLSQRTPTPTTSSAIVAPSPSSSSSSEEGLRQRQVMRRRQGRACPGWETYQRVRAGRQMRSRSKRRRTAAEGGADGEGGEGEEWQTCPVCDAHVDADTADDMRAHIERCLRKAEVEFEDEDVDVEGDADDHYEEYEWCGQTRVRATQMLRAEGQLHALGTKVERGSEDEMVDVCDDADDAFGPAQYDDSQLLRLGHDHGPADDDPGDRERDDRDDPRTHNTSCESMAVSESSLSPPTPPLPPPPPPPSTCENAPPTGDHPGCAEQHAGRRGGGGGGEGGGGGSLSDGLSSSSSCSNNTFPKSNNSSNNGNSSNGGSNGGSSGSAVVEALRARVMELEEERRSVRCTCRVCHGEYEKPLVSVSCWHIHCEQCWLHALAAKKLCPQCSSITSTADLRRVYL